MSATEHPNTLRRAAAWSLALALLLSIARLPPAHAQSTADTICWPPGRLASREGEQLIRRATRVVLPLQRTPIEAAPIPAERRSAIRRVRLPKGLKLIALTFDLCEEPHEVAGYQGEIVDYLRANGIRATFFAGGKWMLSHKERAQQLMADRLFEIGNHGWEHRNLRLLSGPELVGEIASAQIAYEKVREELAARQCLGADGRPAEQRAPRRMAIFRFPFGACNPQALDAVGEMGLRAIQWDIASGDPWVGQTPELMAKAIQASAKPGSIVVFHANGRGRHTASALPLIVEHLKAQGYGFATVSELLKAGSVGEREAPSLCYDIRPGDTDKYDKLAQHLATLTDRWRAKMQPGSGATFSTGFKTEINKAP